MQNRKPYVRPITRTWWAEHEYFSWYMVREVTIIPLIIFTLNFTVGLFSLTVDKNAWENWVDFSAHPLMLIISALAFLGALYHAKTFFSMMPQVMPVTWGGKTVPKSIVVAVQWVMVLACTMAVLLLV